MEGAFLQTGTQMAMMAVGGAMIVAIIIGAIFFAIQKRSIATTLERVPAMAENMGKELEKTQSGFESISHEMAKTQGDFRNLSMQVMNLPHTNEVQEIQERMSHIINSFNTLQAEISDKIDKNHLEHATKLDQTRNDLLGAASDQLLEKVDSYIKENSVKREDYARLKAHIERMIGADASVERIETLSKIFESYNIKTLNWQCKLINLLKGGLAPNAEQDVILSKGIPQSSYKSFLSNLEKLGAVEKKKEWSYWMVPEFEWLYSFTNDPALLQKSLETEVVKEREYQDYIRDHMGLIEDGLIVEQAEYKMETGVVDFLCTDSGGRRVGIELKYPAATTKAIWQVTEYKTTYIKETNLDNCRFFLVAPEIPDPLKEALTARGIEYREIPYS